MNVYSTYPIDSAGHIVSRIDLVCADDDTAKERARQLVDGNDIELWEGHRPVANFDRTSR